MKASLVAVLRVAAALLSACEEEGEGEGGCFTTTIVDLDEGSVAETALLSLGQAPLCNLRLYDRAGRTGNELCLIGKGTARLSMFPRRVCTPELVCTNGTWQDAVRSLWAQQASGALAADGTGFVRGFLPGSAFDLLTPAAQSADYVMIE